MIECLFCKKRDSVMKLRLITEKIYFDGRIEIEVDIINKMTKRYTYILNSRYAHGKFQMHYNVGRHGRALAILNKFKLEVTNGRRQIEDDN